jgi:hypothetical protein
LEPGRILVMKILWAFLKKNIDVAEWQENKLEYPFFSSFKSPKSRRLITGLKIMRVVKTVSGGVGKNAACLFIRDHKKTSSNIFMIKTNSKLRLYTEWKMK